MKISNLDKHMKDKYDADKEAVYYGTGGRAIIEYESDHQVFLVWVDGDGEKFSVFSHTESGVIK